MTIFKLDIKRGRISLIVWTLAISFMLFVCLMIFPQMKGQMNEISDMYASMGSFTKAFGMDSLNFGEIMGFYGVECGNIMGIGGALFAALIGISALANEEKNHTAEFLLTHPVSRIAVVKEKLFSVIFQLVILNIAVVLVSLASFAIIGEKPDIEAVLLLHFAYFIMQVEIGFVCFAVSAFIKRGGLGIGIGFAAIMYFFNIIGNISEDAEFLKYITPFGYAEASDIISVNELDGIKISIGIGVTAAAVILPFYRYSKKDINI